MNDFKIPGEAILWHSGETKPLLNVKKSERYCLICGKKLSKRKQIGYALLQLCYLHTRSFREWACGTFGDRMPLNNTHGMILLDWYEAYRDKLSFDLGPCPDCDGTAYWILRREKRSTCMTCKDYGIVAR